MAFTLSLSDRLLLPACVCVRVCRCGRLFDLPLSCRQTGLVPLQPGQKNIRFAVPASLEDTRPAQRSILDSSHTSGHGEKKQLKPQAKFIVIQALLKPRDPTKLKMEVMLPKMRPAPWVASRKHWRESTESGERVEQDSSGIVRLTKQVHAALHTCNAPLYHSLSLSL